MISTVTFCFGFIIILFISSCTGVTLCHHANQCGWNSLCENGECICVEGFQLGYNGVDCIDDRCRILNCVQCATSQRCKRCVDFIEASSGRCLTSCETRFSLVIDGDQLGKVCDESPATKAMTYAAFLVALSASIVMSLLFSALCYFQFRTEREKQFRLKLFGQMLEREAQIVEMKEDQQATTSLPKTSQGEALPQIRNIAPVNKLKYIHQITTLQPKQETFLEMLSKARLKAHTLQPDTDKCYIFINLASQLSRVVTILTEPDAACPSDGNFLLDWAQRLLEQHEERRHLTDHPRTDHQAASTSKLLQFEQDQAKSASFA